MERSAAPVPPLAVTARLDLLDERVASLESRLTDQLDRALQALELLIDDEPGGRRRLAELRASSSYEDAYHQSSPMVSVIIPTWNRTETLIGRAIPSVLAQTHNNVEAVVVGDAAPLALTEAVAEIADPRVRFINLTIRGPYDEDPLRAWCASGTPPMNAGLAAARGQWLTCIGDDDSLPPEHVEKLLVFARSNRLEFVCGRYRHVGADGESQMVGSFPPQLGSTGLQIALWHSGLRFLQFELAHSVFTTPNDWGLIRRMMRIGVSMGQAEDIVVDYTPSGRGHGFGGPSHDETPQLRRQLAELRDQMYELKTHRNELAARLSAVEQSSGLAQSEFHRRLDEVVQSRSWRVTAPLRRAVELRRRRQNARR